MSWPRIIMFYVCAFMSHQKGSIQVSHEMEQAVCQYEIQEI
jgi:hypothetical protein